MKKFWILLLGATLWGCQTNSDATQEEATYTERDKDEIKSNIPSHNVRIEFAPRTILYQADSLVNITCDGNHITINASDSTISGLMVWVSGRCDDGSIKIYGNVPVQIELYNLRLTSQRGAAINCQSKKRLWLFGSGRNYLTDATKYQTTEGEDCKGTIFSEGQIILCGEETECKITARGGHGIASDDYIRVMDGQWNINSTKDGLHANDKIQMDKGLVCIEAGSDGVDCKEGSVELKGGKLNIRCVDDGVAANRPKAKKNKKNSNKADTIATAKPKKEVRADVTITAHTQLDIHTTGPKGSGVKADQDININGSVAVNIEVDGNASKCLNAGECCTIGGDLWCSCCTGTTPTTINLIANGGVLVNPKKNDTSSPKGIKADSLVLFEGFPQVYVDVPNAGEGIESKGRIEINGGTIEVKAWDDAMNAGRSFVLNAGELFLRSWHNDGLDSNGTIEINGNRITAWGGDIPEAGIDCDMNRFAINGGTVVGVGGTSSAPTEGTQASVIVRGVNVMGQSYGLYDHNGTCIDIMIGSPVLPNATILYSNETLNADSTYYLHIGDSDSTATTAAFVHKPLMPPPPPAGAHPHDGKMPPPPHDGKIPPPPGGFKHGTPPPPPAPQGEQAR